ncbi:hypothetical protein GCM10010177_39180 [Actinomadura citrea]|nr:hypothetical protein GCM10010177_39180 [Actinomadura citrea]
MRNRGSCGVTMTACAVTVPSGSPSVPAGPPSVGVADGADGEPVPGAPVSGPPDGVPAGGSDGSDGTDTVGVGVGSFAWAPTGTVTAETHVAANAAPQTSTLRTPGPFFTNLAR